MTDIVDPLTRSRMMSGIRDRNTKPERTIRSLLHLHGFRFRLHMKNLPGRPDIVLPKYHVAINVMGCFWHGHECETFRWPSTRRDFWRQKILANRRRDAQVFQQLRASGWRVATVWECALRGQTAWNREKLARSLSYWLKGKSAEVEISSELGDRP
jgi:DNA mismatch endonuclease, patch repair protein